MQMVSSTLIFSNTPKVFLLCQILETFRGDCEPLEYRCTHWMKVRWAQSRGGKKLWIMQNKWDWCHHYWDSTHRQDVFLKFYFIFWNKGSYFGWEHTRIFYHNNLPSSWQTWWLTVHCDSTYLQGSNIFYKLSWAWKSAQIQKHHWKSWFQTI